MGINAELVSLIASLRRSGPATDGSVIELGDQAVCVATKVAADILREHGLPLLSSPVVKAADLYRSLGYTVYSSIDASGENGALVFDLNKDIGSHYDFREQFDLVTNLGTAEHCFDQRSVFKNIHDLCRTGGLMIHAAPSQGNVNHSFYNYHPRFFMDLAKANGYEVVNLSFTVDYTPRLIEYSKENFRKWDSHDILLYAVLRKTDDREFVVPFDGMFSQMNALDGYYDTGIDPLVTEYSPYLKGGRWENTHGIELLSPAPVKPNILIRAINKIFGG